MIISFDFDDTLTMPEIGKNGLKYVPRPEYVKIAKDEAAKGNTIIIVTARSSVPRNKAEIEAFIKDQGLSVDSVHYTNHEMKGPLLAKLKADVHYDDREEQIASANSHGVKGVLVPAVDPWEGISKACLSGSRVRRS